MSVNIKGRKGVTAQRAAEIRQALNLPEDAEIAIGATKTYVGLTSGARLTIPEGVGTVSAEKVAGYVEELRGPAGQGGEHAFTDSVEDDEAWAASVAPKILPPVRGLNEVTELYQPVAAVSSTSHHYVTCFVGENLVGVCRISNNVFDVKFRGRATVHPSAEVIEILKLLNVRTVKSDYVTAHVHLSSGIGSSRAIVRGVLGGFYAALREHIHTPFPDVEVLMGSG